MTQPNEEPIKAAGIEKIRDFYRPDKIKVLFVGESPPASGKFFYLGDLITTFTMRSFERAYKRSFSGHEQFLDKFKSLGCFLDDLTHKPVNHMPRWERERELQNSMDNLAERIRDANPIVVIAIFKKIEKYVRQAIKRSGIPATVYVLYPPGYGHQNKYIEGLFKILKRHLVTEAKTGVKL